MNPTDYALVYFMLFLILPAWGIAGFIDWYCHKKSKIEETTGILESLFHSVMGIQVGLPIFLCLLFKVNALILVICASGLVLHEIVAHLDLTLAVTKRHISTLETQAHTYLATIPMFSFLVILAINFELVEKLLVSRNELKDQWVFVRNVEAFGGEGYLFYYSLLSMIFGIFPYLEEVYRCLNYRGYKRRGKV